MVGGLAVILVVEALQAGLCTYQQAALEKAIAAAARQVMVGSVQTSGMTSAQFAAQILCPALPAEMACANVTVDARVVSEGAAPNGFYAFAASDMSGLVPMPSSAAATFCGGTSGAVVYLRASYLAPALSPAFRAWGSATGTSLNGAPAYQVTSYAAFRNEPFQGGGNGC